MNGLAVALPAHGGLVGIRFKALVKISPSLPLFIFIDWFSDGVIYGYHKVLNVLFGERDKVVSHCGFQNM